LFILTGCWQTVTTDEEKEREGGWWHTLIQDLSSIHTDDYFPPGRPGPHSHLPFKLMVVGMAIGLLVSIFIGLVLATKAVRAKWLIGAAFLLGILIPAFLLWLG
jgi:hypothetical protein